VSGGDLVGCCVDESDDGDSQPASQPAGRQSRVEVPGALLDRGRFGTDSDGYQAMLAAGRKRRGPRLPAVAGAGVLI
jgi:hypothetical protein